MNSILSHRILPRLRALLKSRVASASVEFTLVTPLLVTSMLGSAEFGRYYRYERHVGRAAKYYAQVLAAQVNTDGAFNNWFIHYGADSMMQNFPEIMTEAAQQHKNWWDALVWGGSIIQFTPTTTGCTTACTYTGKTNAWWGGSLLQCGAIQLAATETGAFNTVPTGLASQSMMFRVDISFQYQPLFGSKLVNPITIRKVGYAAPTNAMQINVTNVSDMQMCP